MFILSKLFKSFLFGKYFVSKILLRILIREITEYLHQTNTRIEREAVNRDIWRHGIHPGLEYWSFSWVWDSDLSLISRSRSLSCSIWSRQASAHCWRACQSDFLEHSRDKLHSLHSSLNIRNINWLCKLFNFNQGPDYSPHTLILLSLYLWNLMS